MHCGFQWYAPLIMPNDKVVNLWQRCTLPKHHEDDHMSVFKVTAPNQEKSD